jgi:hypothetical protein
MGETAIEWTDFTFNPWIGCQKVSPGCDHCYAETWDARGLQGQARRWGPDADRTRTSAANWNKPLAWNKAAGAAGKRARVFCASLADVFDNHASIKLEWRDDLYKLIEATPHLDWLLLTKRPQNVSRFVSGWMGPMSWPANVWLGTTVENQREAERRIPHLLSVPARVRFLSCEPLLEPLDLKKLFHVRATRSDPLASNQRIHWVICGGESGPGARPMNPDWARGLQQQCQDAGIAFHFKQWGEWAPMSDLKDPDHVTETTPRAFWHDAVGLIEDTLAAPDGLDFFSEGHVFKVGKKRGGRLLDGCRHDGFPT